MGLATYKSQAAQVPEAVEVAERAGTASLGELQGVAAAEEKEVPQAARH